MLLPARSPCCQKCKRRTTSLCARAFGRKRHPAQGSSAAPATVTTTELPASLLRRMLKRALLSSSIFFPFVLMPQVIVDYRSGREYSLATQRAAQVFLIAA